MFRWVFVVLAFAAMMIYGSFIYAEEEQTADPAPETAVETSAPAPEAVPADEGAPSAPADTGTTDEAPVKAGGGSCIPCGGK